MPFNRGLRANSVEAPINYLRRSKDGLVRVTVKLLSATHAVRSTKGYVHVPTAPEQCVIIIQRHHNPTQSHSHMLIHN